MQDPQGPSRLPEASNIPCGSLQQHFQLFSKISSPPEKLQPLSWMCLDPTGPSRTLQDSFRSEHDPPRASPTEHDLLVKSQTHQCLASAFVNPIKLSKFSTVFDYLNAMNGTLKTGGSSIWKKIAKKCQPSVAGGTRSRLQRLTACKMQNGP